MPDKPIQMAITLNGNLPILTHVWNRVSVAKVSELAARVFLDAYADMGIEVDYEEIEFEIKSYTEEEFKKLSSWMIEDQR